MPRTRDGFVPLGDVSQAVALPGDRALTHRADASPARRPFTRLDQVTRCCQSNGNLSLVWRSESKPSRTSGRKGAPLS